MLLLTLASLLLSCLFCRNVWGHFIIWIALNLSSVWKNMWYREPVSCSAINCFTIIKIKLELWTVPSSREDSDSRVLFSRLCSPICNQVTSQLDAEPSHSSHRLINSPWAAFIRGCTRTSELPVNDVERWRNVVFSTIFPDGTIDNSKGILSPLKKSRVTSIL